MLNDLPRDIIIPKKGPRAWLRRLKCWWRGEHDWDKKNTQKRPYPWRPLYCEQCGDKWTYFNCVIPPPMPGKVHKECPNCWLLEEHTPGEKECRCSHCGWLFSVQDREVKNCSHCGNTIALGDKCSGCGAPS